MEVIRARFRGDVYYAARVIAVFSAYVIGGDAKLLHCIR